MSMTCVACLNPLAGHRPYLRCLTCFEYYSCPDCQLLERFVGGHSAYCFYEVWLGGEVCVVKDGIEARRVNELAQPPSSSSAATTTSGNSGAMLATTQAPSWSGGDNGVAGNGSNASYEQTPESFNPAHHSAPWDAVITPQKTLSPLFRRVLSAIFDHYDRTTAPYQTFWLEPIKFSSILRDAGKTATEYPVLTIALKPQPSIDELRFTDLTFSSFYENTGLDFQMATRPELAQFGTLNTMPVLSKTGFEEFWLLETLLNPSSSFVSLQNLLERVPTLVDPETQQPFPSQRIPRDCFPMMPDPQTEVYAARLKQRQVTMASQEERMKMEQTAVMQNMEIQRIQMEMVQNQMVQQHQQQVQAQMMGAHFAVPPTGP